MTEHGSKTVTSPPTDPLAPPSAPEKLEDPWAEGDAVIGGWLYGVEGSWRGAQPLDYQVTWLGCDAQGDNCAAIPGAVDWSYGPRAEDLGRRVRLEVTAANDLGEVTARSAASPPVRLPDPPDVESAPSIYGDAAAGETLAAERGEWSSYPTAFAYQWQLCSAGGEECADVAGATEDSYHVPQADEGSRVRVVVTAANDGGETAAASEPTGVIGPVRPPENRSEPSLQGAVREGVEVTADDGGWGGGTPMTFDYQWQRCDDDGQACADIPGALARGYTPVAEDVSDTLRVRVRATNDAGSDEALSWHSHVARGAPRFVDPRHSDVALARLAADAPAPPHGVLDRRIRAAVRCRRGDSRDWDYRLPNCWEYDETSDKERAQPCPVPG